jgi:hypothetical protein
MKNQTLKNISDIRQLKIKLAKEEKVLKMKQDSLARIKIQRFGMDSGIPWHSTKIFLPST